MAKFPIPQQSSFLRFPFEERSTVPGEVRSLFLKVERPCFAYYLYMERTWEGDGIPFYVKRLIQGSLLLNVAPIGRVIDVSGNDAHILQTERFGARLTASTHARPGETIELEIVNGASVNVPIRAGLMVVERPIPIP